MIMSGAQIQSILKTHHKSVRWGEKKREVIENRSIERHRVEISVEGRKKQIRERATHQMIERLTGAQKTSASPRGKTGESA
jgi:hypothetical protein